MNTEDLANLPWRKSAWSGDGNATCVEVVVVEGDRD